MVSSENIKKSLFFCLRSFIFSLIAIGVGFLVIYVDFDNTSLITFISNRSGSQEIFLMDEKTGEIVKQVTSLITHGNKKNLGCDYSPILNKVVFSSKLKKYYKLYLVNPDGSGLRKLSSKDLKHNCDPCFSPNGRDIVFVSTYNRNFEICKMEIKSGYIKRLTETVENEWSPRFSKDGKFITFVRYSIDKKSPDVYIMNSDGKNIKQITYHYKFDFDPDFSIDGKKIVFCSNRDSKSKNTYRNYEVYIIELSEGIVDRLTYTENATEWNPRFTKDGKIIFETNRDQNDISKRIFKIYLMDTNGSNQKRITKTESDDFFDRSSLPDKDQIDLSDCW